MFKRKPIYIILLVVFTLLLAADITAYVITANSSVSDGSNWSQDGSWPQTSDGQFPAMPSDGSGTMQGGGMPQTSDGEYPATTSYDGSADQTANSQFGGRPGMNSGEMPSFDSSQMQGTFGGSDTTGRPGSSGTVSALSSFISGWWIPIGIFCLLVDGFSVLMLIRIGKKRSQAAEGSEEEAEALEETQEKKPKLSGYEKRQRKHRRTTRILLVILGVVLVIALGYVAVRAAYLAQLAQADTVSVVTAEAAGADIDKVISGTGTLTDADAQEITIPGGVEISAYYVEDGDTVTEGNVLATVDHTSVMKAIADLQDAMDALDDDIDAASSEEIASTITASVDGRVKVIYAEAGTGVADTMYDNGALMLISLDGLMAVDIETDADIATGDSVTVQLADGTELTGRVASFSEGVAAITVTDDGTTYGEIVMVSDEAGNVLGTGELYIHSELKVTGYSGTVSKIKCAENGLVDAGDTLLTLTDTEYTAEYQALLATRSDYEEQMIALFQLYQDGNIYAEYSGTISGVDEDLLIATTRASQTGYASASQTTGTITDLVASKKDSAAVMTLLGNNPSGADDTTVGAYSNYAATVSSVAYSAISTKEYPASVSITDYSAYTSLGITSDMMTTDSQISPDVSTPVYMYENGAWTSYSVSDISAGDVLILTYDSSDRSNLVWIVIASKGQTGENGGSGYTGGSHSGSSGTTSDTTTEETEPTYTITESTAMSVTPADTMSVTITVDELDILSLKTGQEATVTLDALRGETYTGSVTDIDLEGTNSGGSTKYTAVVTLDRTEQMLAGMNAAVSITLSSKECTVTIPVAALNETKSGVVVYTSYDEDTETLGGPVEVTTGLSDGTSVEILSGLDTGAAVWYEYDDTVDISSSVVSSSNGSGFNLMRIFGGGTRRG